MINTNESPEPRFQFDANKFEMLFPGTTTVEDALIQFLKKANLAPDLSVDKIGFLWKARILNEPELLKKRLNQMNISNPIINVRVILRGCIIGGGGPVEFCDLSKKSHESHKLTSGGHTYRTTGKGINIYGICKGKSCEANDKEVIVPINKRTLDLVNEKYDLKCPICSNIIIPKTVGFRNCEYKISGKKYENYKIENFNYIDRAENSREIK